MTRDIKFHFFSYFFGPPLSTRFGDQNLNTPNCISYLISTILWSSIAPLRCNACSPYFHPHYTFTGCRIGHRRLEVTSDLLLKVGAPPYRICPYRQLFEHPTIQTFRSWEIAVSVPHALSENCVRKEDTRKYTVVLISFLDINFTKVFFLLRHEQRWMACGTQKKCTQSQERL